jgi:hypothetical protein
MKQRHTARRSGPWWYLRDRVTRRLLLTVGFVLAFALLVAPSKPPHLASTLPGRLSDSEFWRIVMESSEEDGYFRSDNLTSNELLYQRVIPDLVKRVHPGGVYLGVGPEQNFAYIAAIRPAIAIIVDIRRGNLLVQLMYKAIFELSKNRADFVSMLFSRRKPTTLKSDATVAELFAAFGALSSDEALYKENLKAIQDRLMHVHHLPLSETDLSGIEYAYRAFYSRGFAVRFSPTYDSLMVETDSSGVARGYLANEASFAVVKDIESRNLIVPMVGDFAGPKALRAIGTYLKGHSAIVSAFYLSNVEQYLYAQGKWMAFCRNVSTLPLESSSLFIRASAGRGLGFGVGFVTTLSNILSDIQNCD